jgi:hypothetical protein
MEVDEVAGHSTFDSTAFGARFKVGDRTAPSSMSARGRAFVVAIGVVALAAAGAEARPRESAPAPRVTPDAVWSPPEGFVAGMHRACDARSGEDFGVCFVEEMRRAGASDAAIAFAHATSDQGYLKEFRTTGGPVDIGCAVYPFRANENAVCFLVNGTPPLLDVDDAKTLDPDGLRRNPAYAGLLRAYPNLAVFPGPRAIDDGVDAHLRPEGGQFFRITYALVDGCHACARVGVLRLDFDFDAAGRFTGTRVVSVRGGLR